MSLTGQVAKQWSRAVGKHQRRRLLGGVDAGPPDDQQHISGSGSGWGPGKWGTRMAVEHLNIVRSLLESQRDADEGSVEVARVRRDGDGHIVVAASFRLSGQERRTMFGMREASDGWRIGGGGFEVPRSMMTSGTSWQSGRFGLPSGRRVLRFWVDHPAAVRVRITDRNGDSLEDTLEEGVALFIWDHDSFPDREVEVELIDRTGAVVEST